MRFLILAAALLPMGSVVAAEIGCPLYTASDARIASEHREQEWALKQFRSRSTKLKNKVSLGRQNFIDEILFSKMEADGVAPAELTTDAEFLRRVTLDLTGRIPSVEAAQSFLVDSDTDKRRKLVESLMSSDAFVDQFTLYLANKFEVTGRFYNFISTQSRNRFHFYLRDYWTRDRSYADLATELLTASGDSYTNGPLNFLVRGYQPGDPVQDTWDAMTDRITTRFLGMKTECISCHDGRRHLEEINLFLTPQKRQDFWRMSAFLSRTTFVTRAVDAFNQQYRMELVDRSSGAYPASVPLTNPGQRPYRSGGPYEPAYINGGQVPQSEEWRKEFAKFITNDRQFSRAAVNYLWAYFFTEGIVDPPDAWDLKRIDPKNPPPAPWALQPSNPELLDALADEFQRKNYSLRTMIRLIVNSSAYQLSSNYAGNWRNEYYRYFARHIPRRLSPEQVYDAISIATRTETPMVVEGFPQPLLYANQLPDPSEPRADGRITRFLSNFGRGDWWNLPLNLKSTTIQVLYMMNDSDVNYRTFTGRDGGRPTRVAYLMDSTLNDEDAVRHLFLATLTRPPTDEELRTVLTARKGAARDQWLTDIQWVLLNKLDFLFTY